MRGNTTRGASSSGEETESEEEENLFSTSNLDQPQHPPPEAEKSNSLETQKVRKERNCEPYIINETPTTAAGFLHDFPIRLPQIPTPQIPVVKPSFCKHKSKTENEINKNSCAQNSVER